MTARPLDGVRVLDLSRVLAGPWAGQILADLGADVIKVERPGAGDDTRTWGPPFARRPGRADGPGTPDDSDGGEPREAAYFLAANRAKRSVTIDLARPEGQELVRALARRADVVIENMKVGGLARYGLDHASLAASNPGLVWCSITGFGRDGPYAARAGYDFMIQGMSGLMSVTGEPDEVPGGGPVKVGVAVVDLLTGLYAAIAVLAALRHRERTGQGQHLDLALFDCAVAGLANQALNYLVSGEAPGRLGNAHPNIVPYQTFRAADGHLIVAVGNDGQFEKLARVLGAPELSMDPRFATNPARVAHRAVLVPLLAERLATRPRAAWLGALEAAGVPAGPIATIAEAFSDPQARHRGLVLDLPHAALGNVPGVASPLRLAATPVTYGQGPPALGEHTEEVLREVLGLAPERLADLRAAGVI